MATMRQVWTARRGGPEALEVREVPLPEPAAGEVRVRVAAAGVNFADVMMRRGLYPDAPGAAGGGRLRDLRHRGRRGRRHGRAA